MNEHSTMKHLTRRFVSDYGMLFGLLALCAYFTFATISPHHPEGPDAAEQVARNVLDKYKTDDVVIVVAQGSKDGKLFASQVVETLRSGGMTNVEQVVGEARDLRIVLDRMAFGGATQPSPPTRPARKVAAIATTKWVTQWGLIGLLDKKYPALGDIDVVIPQKYMWSRFFTVSNLKDVSERNIVIAVIAIGMTMVIITGGIDLSVGSLIAMSAMTTAYCIANMAGGRSAGVWGVVLCMSAGIIACGLVGLLNGLMVTRFAIPPFVVTLAMMLVARGLGFIIAGGNSIHELPGFIVWLGHGSDLFGLPNLLVLLVLLYGSAHIMMSRTVLGRYIYAVGGNAEAARLSGVPVKRVIMFCFVMCGLLAGLGGVIRVSILSSGSPNYGEMDELYVIAAVVVGGTSLSGGKGKVFGTLIGVLIISVIQNGMNLTKVQPYTQRVVLGLVILGAVLLDSLRGGKGIEGLTRLFNLKRSQVKRS